MRVLEATKAVCTPLSKRVQIGIVPPEAWRETELCKRPLSWYWTSPRAGQYLLISSHDLMPYDLPPQIVIREVKFRPPSLPDEAGKRARIGRSGYLRAKPPEWDDLDKEDPARLDRWMKVMGIRGLAYRDLFLTHCANHANFIEPVYFVEEGGEKIPYSIDQTKHICSACLEFFGVLGAQFRTKRVVPCPGAVLFAGMVPNRYYEVIQQGDDL
jgi:hypothetical protein